MLGAVMADTVARAPQIFLEIGGKIVIVRGKRPGKTRLRETDPTTSDFSPLFGVDHFGFLYRVTCGILRTTSRERRCLSGRAERGRNGGALCYISAPDGAIELMQC